MPTLDPVSRPDRPGSFVIMVVQHDTDLVYASETKRIRESLYHPLTMEGELYNPQSRYSPPSIVGGDIDFFPIKIGLPACIHRCKCTCIYECIYECLHLYCVLKKNRVLVFLKKKELRARTLVRWQAQALRHHCRPLELPPRRRQGAACAVPIHV